MIGPDDPNRIDVSSFRNSTMNVGAGATMVGTSGAGTINENAGFFRNIFSKNCRAYLTTAILNAMKNLNSSEGWSIFFYLFSILFWLLFNQNSLCSFDLKNGFIL
jgi:hypothetical protein